MQIEVSFDILQCKFIYDATCVLHTYIPLYQSPTVNYSQGVTNTFFRCFFGDFRYFFPVTIHETRTVLFETYLIPFTTFGLLQLFFHVVQQIFCKTLENCCSVLYFCETTFKSCMQQVFHKFSPYDFVQKKKKSCSVNIYDEQCRFNLICLAVLL